jgi:hypothetical protein
MKSGKSKLRRIILSLSSLPPILFSARQIQREGDREAKAA